MSEPTDPGFWRGRRVLVTGHTGFKGAWLTLWLARLGAEVVGFGRGAERGSALGAAATAVLSDDVAGDVRDAAAVEDAVRRAEAEVVFHLAAQAVVAPSLRDPIGTYAINVMGTVHLLEAVRRPAGASVRAVVCVTTDRCYRLTTEDRPRTEDDPLGGRDPYSASKACQELVTAAFRDSLLHRDGTGACVATTRSGNLIGGGDWAEARLVPDLIRAAIAGEPLEVRSPAAVRPWQHVLDPLSGYLTLAERLCGADGARYADAYNFGPDPADAQPVRWMVERLMERWPGAVQARYGTDASSNGHGLRVDATRARERLGWIPRWDLGTGLDATVGWYARERAGEDAQALCEEQIERYEAAVGAPA